MIDPMAGVDPTGPGSEMIDAGGSSDGTQEVFDAVAYRSNFRKMDKIRSFMGIVAGCVAGVLGLNGLAGLACFIILHVAVNLSILAFKMNFKLHAYTKESMVAFLMADLQKCAMSFTLFWTLFFGLVYLF